MTFLYNQAGIFRLQQNEARSMLNQQSLQAQLLAVSFLQLICQKKNDDAKKLLIEAMSTFEKTAGKDSPSYQMANKYLQAADQTK